MKINTFSLKNGLEWEATSKAFIESIDTFSLQASVYNKSGYMREHFVIDNIPLLPGKFIICQGTILSSTSKTSSKYYTIIEDGDVLDGVFFVSEKHENFIQIQEVDKKRKKIIGKFQIMYIQDTLSIFYKTYLPDSIQFTNGFFTANF